MAIPLKYATASQEIPLGHFVDSGDGDTEETALTIANTDIKLWKSGATTLANKNSGGATHISNGIYYCTLDATDTNTYGPMVVFVHVSGALAVRVECLVMEADAYDALYAAAGTGHIEADAVQISGDATAADNAELAFDGTGYGFTGCTVPTVTTLTGHTAQTGDNYARLGAPAGASVSADIAAVKTDTANVETDTQDIQSRLPAGLVAGRMSSDAVAISGSTTAADNVEANIGNLDAAISGLATAANLQTVDDNVDAILLDTGTDGVVLADNAITAAKIATDAIGADEIAAAGANEIADAVLTREWTSVTGEAARSVLNALRFLRNKWSISGSTLTVTEEDDSTSAWTSTLTSDSGADPVTASDPT